MKRTTLDRPTVAEMMALLQTMPPDMPFRIEDPDTNWTIHQVIAYADKGRFWLTGEYCGMDGEDTLPPKQHATPSPESPT